MINRTSARRSVLSLLAVLVLATVSSAAYATKYDYGPSPTTATVRTPTAQLQPGTAGTSTVSHSVYAAVAITSSSLPIYYVPVKLTNNAGSATPVPFQTKVAWVPSTYTAYEAADLGNVRFCSDTACNTMLSAWLESCTSSCSNSASSAGAWVKLSVTIPANGGTITIYMAFLDKSTHFDGNLWGEAPTIPSTYGQNDNGANVFTFYDNFAGTSGPSSSWATSYYGTAGSVATSNMLMITCAAHTASNEAVVEKTAITAPQVAEADILSQTGNQFTDLGVGSGWDSSSSNGVANNGYTISWNGQTGTQFDRFWVDNGGTRNMVDSTAAGSIPALPAGVWSVNWYATGHEVANDGAGNTFTETDSTVTLPGTYVMVIGEASSSGASGTLDVQWARMRASPPSNIMPSVAFGSITQSIILTLSNSGSTPWLANLIVVSTTNTARLNNLTVSFYNPFSKQIILGSVTNQNQGPQVTLANSATISIIMDATVTAAGASTVTMGLKLQSIPSAGQASTYCYDVIGLTVS